MAGPTELERLGRFAATLERSAMPASVRRAACWQLVDMVAAAHAAARTEPVHAVRAALDALGGGTGRATVVASGARRPPIEAAFENAACSMAHDFDDIVWMGHTCHSAVFAALAVAEHEGRSSAELVDAIVVANELAGRVGASSFLGPLNGQMWTFVHLVGAAAAAARLLGLDAERTTHALAIALAQPNFALQPGFLRPSSKLLSAATPLATGLRAAYFARAGMTGAPEILEDRRGFWRRFAYVPMPLALGDLGSFWVLDTFTFKTYPVCHYFQTALEALERLRARAGGELPLARVRRVHVATTKLACEASRFAAEYARGPGGVTPVGVCFDLAQAAAVLLRVGRLGVDELDAGALARGAEEQRAWVARIEVEHDLGLTARVVEGARAVGAGRAALGALGPRELVMLVRRYREEYGSELVSAADAGRALRSLARATSRRVRGLVGAGRRGTEAGVRQARAPGGGAGGIALYFPARVTVELEDGTRLVERIDLPTGSVAAPGAERALEQKLVQAAGPALGRAGALRAFGLMCDAEAHELPALVRAVVPG
ncbi:MAG: MmgE/PrpD family protein [Myxococcales bacterium]|nr:MmgE/PrpD family protein [Myxococcales bacterium]